MKVSVCILAYNHARFIAQCLDSVLQQVCSFEWEVLIGEDGSTDGTREIVQQYATRNPGRIRLFLRSREDVVYIQGRPTGRFNFVETLKEARGDYVAMLDGDDYWLSDRKLQTQVDYMDAHSECALCFHHAIIVDESGMETHRAPNARVNRKVYTLEHLLEGEFFPWTCGVVFRRGLYGAEFPDWYWQAPTGDFPLHVLNAEHGHIGLIDEYLGAYRIHHGGVWSSGELPGSWENMGDADQRRRAYRLKSMLIQFQLLQTHFGRRHHVVIANTIANLAYDLVWLHRCRGEWPAMRKMLWLAARNRFRHPQVQLAFVLKSWLLAYVPLFRQKHRQHSSLLATPASQSIPRTSGSAHDDIR